MSWAKQVRISLDGLAIFLDAVPGALRRSWKLNHFITPASSLTMVLGASPLSASGEPYMKGVPSLIHDIIDGHDQQIHHHQRGDHKGHQVSVCLVVLIKLRVWKKPMGEEKILYHHPLWQHECFSTSMPPHDLRGVSVDW